MLTLAPLTCETCAQTLDRFAHSVICHETPEDGHRVWFAHSVICHETPEDGHRVWFAHTMSWNTRRWPQSVICTQRHLSWNTRRWPQSVICTQRHLSWNTRRWPQSVICTQRHLSWNTRRWPQSVICTHHVMKHQKMATECDLHTPCHETPEDGHRVWFAHTICHETPEDGHRVWFAHTICHETPEDGHRVWFAHTICHETPQDGHRVWFAHTMSWNTRWPQSVLCVADILPMGDNFVCGYVQQMDGEKDPRNLMLAFRCSLIVCRSLSLGNLDWLVCVCIHRCCLLCVWVCFVFAFLVLLCYWIANFYSSVTSCAIIRADLPFRYADRLWDNFLAQDGIVALGKAYIHSALSLNSLLKVALETEPIFVWLNTDRSRPWTMECQLLPFSTPLSFRRSVLRCSGLSMFRKFLKPLSTYALPSSRPDVISAVLASLSAHSFPLTPVAGHPV